jgi:exodeoxyribonuclease V alpha subunit
MREGWLRPLDRAFAHFLGQEVPDATPLALLAAALASHQLGRGHACLDLGATLRNPGFALSLPPEGAGTASGEPPPHPATLLEGLTVTAWRAALDQPEMVGTGPGGTPLVLAGPRLYLRRYWEYERAVSHQIAARLADVAADRTDPPSALLRRTLDRLFPATPIRPDWQKIACALAARGAFSVITGGPGTGKTTTVVRLLALLQALALTAPAPGKRPRALRIRLAAPTGKAAARLNEAIAGAVASLPLAELEHAGLGNAATLRASIPLSVTTLHRLLGSRPDTRRLRHHAGNPLALDLLVIDEASMIDLEMMAAVLAALPPQARLVLLGDKDQLASVEAGAVLGQLCQRAAGGHYTPATRDWLETATGAGMVRGEGARESAACATHAHPDGRGPEGLPLANPGLEDLIDPAGTALDQAVVMLRHSHRFAADSGIGQLAAAVNASSAAGVRDIWARGHQDLALLAITNKAETAFEHPDTTSNHLDTAFRQLLIRGWAPPAPGAGGATGGAAPTLVQSSALSSPVGSSALPPRVGSSAIPPRVGYRHFLEVLRQQRPPEGAAAERYDDWARAVLAAQGQFQVLCALRQGPWGVEGLNETIAHILGEAGLIPASDGWYLGRPVLVTRNDYGLGLMNGDIGVTLAYPTPGGGPERLRVAFPAGDGRQGMKWVLPSRLQAVETVYALTVHKSQGSEFTHVALVLPDKPSPILNRELLYTGITRARHYFTLVRPGDERVLEQAVERRVLRATGLLAQGD